MRACGTPHAQGRNPKGLLSSLSAFNYNTFLFLFQYIFSYKSLQQPLLRRRHPRAFPFYVILECSEGSRWKHNVKFQIKKFTVFSYLNPPTHIVENPNFYILYWLHAQIYAV